MTTNYPRPDLSVDAAADELGLERKSVLALIHAGDLSAYDARRPGRRRATYRIRAAALDEFRRRRAIVPPAPTVRPARRRSSAMKQYV